MNDTLSKYDQTVKNFPFNRLRGPILVHGFATAVAMWCAWFLTHLPGAELPPRLTALVLLPVWFGGLVWCGMRAPAGRAWLAGAGAGVLAGLLNLLVLGAFLAKPPDVNGAPAPGFEGLRPSAAVVAPCFLLVGAVLGAAGGFIGSRIRRAPDTNDAEWLGRFGIVAAVAVIPLLLLGGAVTSTSSGLSVPGWPDSYGANMFLFPIALMSHPRV